MPSITNGIINNIRKEVGNERSEYAMTTYNKLHGRVANRVTAEDYAKMNLGKFLGNKAIDAILHLGALIVGFMSDAALNAQRFIRNLIVDSNNKKTAGQPKQEPTISTVNNDSNSSETVNNNLSTLSTLASAIANLDTSECQIGRNKNNEISFVGTQKPASTVVSKEIQEQTATTTQIAASTVLSTSSTVNNNIIEESATTTTQPLTHITKPVRSPAARHLKGSEAAEKKAARAAARQNAQTLIERVCIAGFVTLAGITLYQNADSLRTHMADADALLRPQINGAIEYVSSSMPSAEVMVAKAGAFGQQLEAYKQTIGAVASKTLSSLSSVNLNDIVRRAISPSVRG